MDRLAATKRIAPYSHDARGLGHMRRNLAIAQALSDGPDRAVLLLAGAREAALFPMPAGTDCVALPALGKDGGGGYCPRSLALSYAEVLALRSGMVRSALENFAPNGLIVDKLPLGVGDERKPALEELTERGDTQVVLGMREVLDEPSVVCRECPQAVHQLPGRLRGRGLRGGHARLRSHAPARRRGQARARE